MMRNKTAFIFVLLANLVLWVHAVIPHHHHVDNTIALIVDCTHQEGHNHIECSPICCEEGESSETTACSLGQAILIPGNSVSNNELSSEVVSLISLFFTFGDFRFSLHRNFFINAVYGIAESIPLYSRLLVSSQGLRAPPVC
ncbi:DUF6769 family protein [Saccharicrinis sp. GN24d3]|uniref:DUF6769 family protein n=1 Tax=Saccharicrinis sp. GN24d3 TaxID=3458416 RepID=UPI004036B4B4